jgi:hypothetical protein
LNKKSKGFDHYHKNRETSQNTRVNLTKNVIAAKTIEQLEYEELLNRHQMLEKMYYFKLFY